MEKFTYNSKTVEVPSYLDEVSSEQYRQFLILSVLMNRGTISPGQFRVKWLSFLLGMKADYTMYRREIIQELDGQLEKLDGFFSYTTGKKGERIVTPILKTGRNLMQDFGGWHGVGDMLNGLTFGNFCDCLDLLQQSRQAAAEKDDPAINEIFQDITLKLYRYKDPEKTPAIPSLLAIHAVNFFSAVWEMVLSGPVYIGGEAIDFRILFQKLASEDRKADDKTGWTGIVFEVAASGVFGNKKEVDDTPFWDVLLYLYNVSLSICTKNVTKNENDNRNKKQDQEIRGVTPESVCMCRGGMYDRLRSYGRRKTG